MMKTIKGTITRPIHSGECEVVVPPIGIIQDGQSGCKTLCFIIKELLETKFKNEYNGRKIKITVTVE